MKKLFIVVATDEVLLTHRLPIAIEAKKRGFNVVIVATDQGRKNEIIDQGLEFININLERRKLSIINEFRIIKSLYKLFKKEKPDIIHSVTIKIVISSAIASKLAGIKNTVNAIAGLGTFFQKNFKSNLIRPILGLILHLVKSQKQIYIFQNEYDKSVFINNKWAKEEQTALIKGAGIDLDKYKYIPEPINNTVNILFATRIVKDKGVLELIEAIKRIRSKGINNIIFTFVGAPTNDISLELLQKWHTDNLINYKGFVKDTSKEIINSNICILPSYSEGLPKSLIEACAIGRAIITTDVPGCRDVVENNVNGILVPPKSIEELEQAILYLSENDKERRAFGLINRKKAEDEFDIKDVVNKTIKIYQNSV